MSTPIPVPTPEEHISVDEWWSIAKMPANYDFLTNTPIPEEVSLHQFGWNVETIGGSRYDLPTKRGDNRRYPYRPGTRHNKNKIPEERVVELKMWVNAVHPGTGESDGERKLRFNDSWNFIRDLVWSWSGDQLILTRRWWQTIQGVAVLHKASALVEIQDSMQPTMTGRFRANFQMTLLLSSPFFYGDPITTRINSGETVNIYNPGQDRSMFEHIVVDMTGPMWKPTLTNATPDPNVWLLFDHALVRGTLVFDIPNFLCTGSLNYIRYVVNAGSRFWFGLVPGSNLVTLTESTVSRPAIGTGGYATIIYRPPYT